jgi:hypothetical protein
MNSDSTTAVDDVTIDDLTFKYVVLAYQYKSSTWTVFSTRTREEAEEICKEKLSGSKGSSEYEWAKVYAASDLI